MAKKDIALTKIAKISQAQQYMILSVLGASLVLGTAISLTMHFVNQIAYNSKVIAAEDESITSYSDFIKKTGVCTSPKGNVYSKDELAKCNPEAIELSQIPGTVRYEILENLAANEALNSVPQGSNSSCINPNTGKNYTFKELNAEYKNASDAESRKAAIQNIKTCSALRVVPDALPSFKNEEALLASLNHIFNLSNWTPESLSPADDSEVADEGEGAEAESTTSLNPIGVNLSIEADTGTTMNILHNIERSIREFNIGQATIEWVGDNSISVEAQAAAYYVNEANITETEETISTGGN